EMNHPSKVVVTEIPVSYPNPNKVGTMINKVVRHESRVLMNDAEAAEHRIEQAKQRLAEHYADDPEGLRDLLQSLAGESAKPKRAKKPAVKKRADSKQTRNK